MYVEGDNPDVSFYVIGFDDYEISHAKSNLYLFNTIRENKRIC